MNDYDIFISYSRLDIELAQKIKKELEEKTNLTFWMDLDGIESASQFEEVIINAIDSSKAVIFLLSEHSMKSEYAKKEVRYASGVQKKLIPVKIDGSSPSGWFLFNFSGIDVIDYNDALQSDKLIRDLKSWFPFSESKSPNVLDKEGECAEIHIETDMDCYVQRFHNTITVAKVGVENVIHLPKGRHKLQFIAVQNSNVRFDCEYKVSDLFESDYIEVSLLEKADIISDRTKDREEQEQVKEKRISDMASMLSDDSNIRLSKTIPEDTKNAIGDVGLPQNTVSLEDSMMFNLDGIEFKMIFVKGGTFNMGGYVYSPHKVTLSSFYIGETQVTQELWKAVMGYNPSHYHWIVGGAVYPVENVSWLDCQYFINKLNAKTGRNFRLPTEAEWEFAARGGIKSRGYEYSGGDKLKKVAWYSKNSNGCTKAVKLKLPNELGLYDMSGNVREWCHDWWESDKDSTYQVNPKGPDSGRYRVTRGGSWHDSSCNLLYRFQAEPTQRDFDIGFRLALSENGSLIL